MNDHLASTHRLHHPVRPEWLARSREEIIDPALEIVDPHHHLWEKADGNYLAQEFLQDVSGGHNVVATVYVNCHFRYRTTGPEALRPVGETEFVAAVAPEIEAMAARPLRACAGIVADLDLSLGAGAAAVLAAHEEAGRGRMRGVRPSVAWHESPEVRVMNLRPGLLVAPESLEAIACIEAAGLTLDIWQFFTQLDEAILVAQKFPSLPIVINHAGGPLGIGPYADRARREEGFALWKERIGALGKYPNVHIKLGGLAMRYGGWPFPDMPAPPDSDLLVECWRPYLDICIDSAGPERCMFESNFPVDKGMVAYNAVWNAFKKYSEPFSDAERARMFSGTAREFYRID